MHYFRGSAKSRVFSKGAFLGNRDDFFFGGDDDENDKQQQKKNVFWGFAYSVLLFALLCTKLLFGCSHDWAGFACFALGIGPTETLAWIESRGWFSKLLCTTRRERGKIGIDWGWVVGGLLFFIAFLLVSVFYTSLLSSSGLLQIGEIAFFLFSARCFFFSLQLLIWVRETFCPGGERATGRRF